MKSKKTTDSDSSNTATPKRILFPDFKILETFVRLAKEEAHNYHRVADQLGVSQPLVTTRIKQLEEYLRVPLFKSDRGRTALTPKGEEFLVLAERLIGMRKMIEAFRDPSSVRGIVRLGVSESIVHTWLPMFMRQLKEVYPDLEIELEVDISPKLLNGLLTEDLDLAFLLEPVSAPNVRSRTLCSFPVAFIAGQEFAFTGEPVLLKDIARHRIITFARNTQPYMALRKLFDSHGLHATTWASASLEAVVQMALDGLGIAAIPPAIIDQKIDVRKKLRRLNAEIELPDLKYLVSWRTTPDDATVQKVADIAMSVARGWPKSR
jgi:DNA-binding transcriptional LysR family regulator